MIPAKRLLSNAGEESLFELKPHVPRELESWVRDLRMQMIDKVEKEMRRKNMENPEQAVNVKRDRCSGRKCQPNVDEAESADYPFLLWRLLQLRGDNSLLVNMLLHTERGTKQRGNRQSNHPESWTSGSLA